MNKKITLSITLLLFVGILFSANADFIKNLKLTSIYNSNILKYSEDDLEDFKNFGKNDKFEIETSDDLIISPELNLGIKHRLFAGHTQVIKANFKYNKFLKNNIKDEMIIGFDLKQYLSKKMNFSLGYSYYPEIYVRNYKSVLDDVYHEFSYAKNVYDGKLNFQFLPLVRLGYGFEFSQLYYNKYFTEYDASNIKNTAELNLKTPGNVSTTFGYSYKVSDADAEDAFENLDEISVIKDSGYESNMYTFSVLMSDFEIGIPIDIYGNFKFEERFFQSDFEDDKYHFGREDRIFTISSFLRYDITKHLQIKLIGKYELRDTKSNFSSVENAKEYNFSETGLNLNFKY